MNIRERVQASRAMTPLQIAEKSIDFRNKYAERMYDEIDREKNQSNKNPLIEESYNKFGGDSEYARPYGTILDWLKLNNLNITPDEFRSNAKYQSAYKNWSENLKTKQPF